MPRGRAGKAKTAKKNRPRKLAQQQKRQPRRRPGAVAEAEAEATAEEETSAHAEEQEAHNPEEMPHAEDYFGYDSSAGASEAPSVSDECSSEHSEEEYSQDGFIYRRENTSHRGHRERHEDSQEYSGHSVTEERPVLSGAEANVPPLFGEAEWIDTYEFYLQRGARRSIAPVRRTMVGGNNGERTCPRASHPQVVLQHLE